MKKLPDISVFVFFLCIYMIFSNQRITTSMDVDVIRYASDWLESGYYGSELKLSAGVSYSPRTGLFYPQEGIGIVAPLAGLIYLSGIISPDSQFMIFTFNQIFSALSMFLVFLILSMLMTKKKAFIYSVLFGIATPVFVHSKYLMPEPITMLSITASLYFLARFSKTGKPVFIFLSGLSAGYSLLARPDSPIFAAIFSAYALYTAYRSGKTSLIKNAALYVTGALVFTSVFFVSNYRRYGSFLETGYTLNIIEVRTALEKGVAETYEKALKAYEKDQTSRETALLVTQFQHRQRFLEDIDKLIETHGEKSTAFYTNGFANFLHGIYLILFSPNRSIIFLSPFLIILLASAVTGLKKYRTKVLFASATFFSYMILYALRAPLSFAGSAAWGIRYMLPVYPLLFLSAILYENSAVSKKKAVKRIFYGLCFLSVAIQLVGSAVNYQSVQMPVEYRAKLDYGEEGNEWITRSRLRMMTGFSSSLPVNNARIIAGSLTPEQKAYGVETGPNDWFFYQVLKGEGMLLRGKEHMNGGFKAMLFMLILSLGSSSYFIYKNIMVPENAGEEK